MLITFLESIKDCFFSPPEGEQGRPHGLQGIRPKDGLAHARLEVPATEPEATSHPGVRPEEDSARPPPDSTRWHRAHFDRRPQWLRTPRVQNHRGQKFPQPGLVPVPPRVTQNGLSEVRTRGRRTLPQVAPRAQPKARSCQRCPWPGLVDSRLPRSGEEGTYFDNCYEFRI